ncbi:MAG: hypothetical protein EZS28_043139 [Streblomastix strix]|uniref:Uncharacterized protein n=1 Tax=Streblomastix strix TaxID=222440 RepID=A0A5J4TVA0_9EUKA|nr:MAG: hypothetical protein EZS28_043139 [Streblomastix strix]
MHYLLIIQLGNYNEGLGIANTTNNLCLISLGCDPNAISGAIANQWSIYKKVIAGTGATNGATNGSVNFSAGNPILLGINSVGTEGRFYSYGAKIYWRAKPIPIGSIPP